MKKVISIVLIILLLSWVLYPLEAKELKKPKSAATAMLLSLGSTAVPIAVVFMAKGRYATWIGVPLGLIIGPSIGHFYAKNNRQALKGILIRGVGAPGVGLITMMVAGAIYKPTGSLYHSDFEGFGIFLAGVIAVGAVEALSALYDITIAPSAVRKYNESIKKTGNVYFVPKVNIKEESYGLSVVYCF